MPVGGVPAPFPGRDAEVGAGGEGVQSRLGPVEALLALPSRAGRSVGHGEGTLWVSETEAAKEPSRVGRGLFPRPDGPMGPTKWQTHHSQEFKDGGLAVIWKWICWFGHCSLGPWLWGWVTLQPIWAWALRLDQTGLAAGGKGQMAQPATE